MQHAFDYIFIGPSSERLTLRLYRASSSSIFSSDDYERIARMLTALHLSKDQKVEQAPFLEPTWRVTVRWVSDFEEACDVDSTQVTENLGRARMEALARRLEDSKMRAWLLQEADLTDVP